ncbi:MAG: hypothetical protein JO295_12440 [Verrucomicrobia bacterium]|nr:hypothetical protein [Verrucomicrobiota bacterium]
MRTYILPGIAGLIGAIAMAVLTLLPARMQMFRIDIVRAVGSFISHDRAHAYKPGLTIHLFVGFISAYFYRWIFDYMGIPLNSGTGLFMGVIHGALVMLLVSIFILEHHPMKRYQRRGFMTGFSQILAHAVYGFIVGTILWLAGSPHHW